MNITELKSLKKSELLRFALKEFGETKLDPKYRINFNTFHKKYGSVIECCFAGCLIRHLHGPEHKIETHYGQEYTELLLWLDAISRGQLRNAYNYIDDKTYKSVFGTVELNVRPETFVADIETVISFLETKGL